MKAVETQEIVKTFGEIRALDGVSLEFEPGIIYALLGPNGAGKTTLIRVLTTLLEPDSGDARVLGIDVASNPVGVRQRIGLAGQYAAVDEYQTGRENIVLFGTLLGRSPQHMHERIGPIAEWAGLTEFLDTPLRNYSTGMISRLGFAIATDITPEILLIDEVLSVGDEGFRKKSTQRIAGLMDGGTTVVLVSHALPTVQRMAHRVLWLDHGQIKMLGDATEVIDAYKASV